MRDQLSDIALTNDDARVDDLPARVGFTSENAATGLRVVLDGGHSALPREDEAWVRHHGTGPGASRIKAVSSVFTTL
ncbi:hypothetical protein [Streptomyces sp. NBC_01429]|uniref:hypothetical protein n=1 Tax=Streptomyces sp. NBC_01429 TaxID=2903862 RepID=UPI002E2CB132|nr:hypothetical protein [Streptomyces sp. NBC_01429]